MIISDAQRLGWILLPDSYVGYEWLEEGKKILWHAARRNDFAFRESDKAKAIDLAVAHTLQTDPIFRLNFPS